METVLTSLLQRLKPITLEEMDSVKLMDRIDTKFVTTSEGLLSILERAVDEGYSALTADGSKITSYDTLYYDTPDLNMYNTHHNGKLVRQKIRVRTYLSSGTTFLEIKRKNNHRRTKKKRIAVPQERFETVTGLEQAREFINSVSRYSAGNLSPKVCTSFDRITLVNEGRTERTTIDTNLRFSNRSTGIGKQLTDAVIIELKQDGRLASPMREILRSLRVMPLRISKYCIGTALTDPTARSNRFKEKIRSIEKMTNNRYL